MVEGVILLYLRRRECRDHTDMYSCIDRLNLEEDPAPDSELEGEDSSEEKEADSPKHQEKPWLSLKKEVRELSELAATLKKSNSSPKRRLSDLPKLD